jgi:CheY-like chemotaxis protein
MHLLLVEDESDTAASVSRALEDLATEDRVVHVRHVEDALTYLSGRPPEIPLLVLLDLETPGGGIRLLETMKQDEALMGIPVIVLTRYLVKPRPYDKLLRTVKAIGDYWRLSQLPTCA